MYPNDFLSHVNVSLRRQAELVTEEKEAYRKWVLTALERLERIKAKLQKEESK